MGKFQQRMRVLLRRGVPFARAARQASRFSRGKTKPLLRGSSVQGIMARRRRGRRSFGRRVSRRGGRRGGRGMLGGLGNVGNVFVRAGTGYAVGVGAKALTEKYLMMAGQNGLIATPLTKILGSWAGYQSAGGGLPGIAAAAPIFLNGSMPSNSNQSSGASAPWT